MPQALPRPPDLPPPQQRRSNRGTPARHDLTDIGDSTGCCASTSPKEPTCPAGPPRTSSPSKPRSTADPEKSSAGRRPPKSSTSNYALPTRQVLQLTCPQFLG